MNRQLLFNIHFYLSSFFTPFLLLIAVTGTFYLFGNKGNVKETLVKSNVMIQKEQEKEQVKQVVKELDANYRYEYLKDRGSSIQTRPTTRDYFNFKKNADGTFNVYKVEPNFLLRLIEVHKGHGPKLLKYFQKVLGFALIFITITGLLMSLKIKTRVKSFLISMTAGGVILFGMFFFL